MDVSYGPPRSCEDYQLIKIKPSCLPMAGLHTAPDRSALAAAVAATSDLRTVFGMAAAGLRCAVQRWPQPLVDLAMPERLM